MNFFYIFWKLFHSFSHYLERAFPKKLLETVDTHAAKFGMLISLIIVCNFYGRDLYIRTFF